MKGQGMVGIVVMIAALHVTVLTVVFGLHHIGYLLTATLSAMLIWGLIFFRDGQGHGVTRIAAIVVGLAVQQVAYHAWKDELPNFWSPVAQFGALHFLVACGLRRELPPEPTTNKETTHV